MDLPFPSRDEVVLMKVADVRLLKAPDGSPTDRCQVVLQEMQGARNMKLRFPCSIGEWMASGRWARSSAEARGRIAGGRSERGIGTGHRPLRTAGRTRTRRFTSCPR